MTNHGTADGQAMYSLLKEYGVKLSAQEGHDLLNALVQAHLKGDQAAAKSFKVISSDLIAQRDQLGFQTHDLQLMASQIVLSLGDRNMNDSLQMLATLEQINGSLFESILYPQQTKDGVVEINVDASYYILWARNRADITFSIGLTEMAFKNVFQENKNALWFHKKGADASTQLTFGKDLTLQSFLRYEMIMYSTIGPTIEKATVAKNKFLENYSIISHVSY